jgi:hypothetical protein
MEIINKPILPDEIEWKVQAVTNKGKDNAKTIIVPYVTARCVMDRFDAQFGELGWQTEFKEITDGFICTLAVTSDKGWVRKQDGASKTKIEPIKGGISDSLKRAAHQFGLGRCLYSYPRIFLKGEHRFIPDLYFNRLDEMVKVINDGTFTKSVVVL